MAWPICYKGDRNAAVLNERLYYNYLACYLKCNSVESAGQLCIDNDVVETTAQNWVSSLTGTPEVVTNLGAKQETAIRCTATGGKYIILHTVGAGGQTYLECEYQIVFTAVAPSAAPRFLFSDGKDRNNVDVLNSFSIAQETNGNLTARVRDSDGVAHDLTVAAAAVNWTGDNVLNVGLGPDGMVLMLNGVEYTLPTCTSGFSAAEGQVFRVGVNHAGALGWTGDGLRPSSIAFWSRKLPSHWRLRSQVDPWMPMTDAHTAADLPHDAFLTCPARLNEAKTEASFRTILRTGPGTDGALSRELKFRQRLATTLADLDAATPVESATYAVGDVNQQVVFERTGLALNTHYHALYEQYMGLDAEENEIWRPLLYPLGHCYTGLDSRVDRSDGHQGGYALSAYTHRGERLAYDNDAVRRIYECDETLLRMDPAPSLLAEHGDLVMGGANDDASFDDLNAVTLARSAFCRNIGAEVFAEIPTRLVCGNHERIRPTDQASVPAPGDTFIRWPRQRQMLQMFLLDWATGDDNAKTILPQPSLAGVVAWIKARTELDAPRSGTLSTRMGDTSGTLTFAAVHGLIATDRIRIYWTGGEVTRALVTNVVDLAVEFTVASGDVLPAEDTAITARQGYGAWYRSINTQPGYVGVGAASWGGPTHPTECTVEFAAPPALVEGDVVSIACDTTDEIARDGMVVASVVGNVISLSGGSGDALTAAISTAVCRVHNDAALAPYVDGLQVAGQVELFDAAGNLHLEMFGDSNLFCFDDDEIIGASGSTFLTEDDWSWGPQAAHFAAVADASVAVSKTFHTHAGNFAGVYQRGNPTEWPNQNPDGLAWAQACLVRGIKRVCGHDHCAAAACISGLHELRVPTYGVHIGISGYGTLATFGSDVPGLWSAKVSGYIYTDFSTLPETVSFVMASVIGVPDPTLSSEPCAWGPAAYTADPDANTVTVGQLPRRLALAVTDAVFQANGGLAGWNTGPHIVALEAATLALDASTCLSPAGMIQTVQLDEFAGTAVWGVVVPRVLKTTVLTPRVTSMMSLRGRGGHQMNFVAQTPLTGTDADQAIEVPRGAVPIIRATTADVQVRHEQNGAAYLTVPAYSPPTPLGESNGQTLYLRTSVGATIEVAFT